MESSKVFLPILKIRIKPYILLDILINFQKKSLKLMQ